VNPMGIKIGSYPHFDKKIVTVSIIGPLAADGVLRNIVQQVERNVEGHEISAEEEDSNNDLVD